MLSIHLKWDFLRRRPEECDSSKNGNQNQDSICGSTPNVKEGAGRLLQQNLPGPAVSRCSKVSGRKINTLLNHLVGASEQRWRNREPERLCSPQIQVHLVARGLLDGDVTRTTTFKDLGGDVCANLKKFR